MLVLGLNARGPRCACEAVAEEVEGAEFCGHCVFVSWHAPGRDAQLMRVVMGERTAMRVTSYSVAGAVTELRVPYCSDVQ